MSYKLKQLFCILFVIFSLGSVSVYADNISKNDISVEVNGTQLKMSHSPQIIENSTLVPLRDISDALNITIEWNENEKTIDVYGINDTYTLEIDNFTVKSKHSNTILLNAAPTIIDNKTFVPIRFIAESMGADILWNDASKTVLITTNEQKQINNLEKIELSLSNKKVYTGQKLSELKKDFGEPSRIDKSIYNLDWYIYNQDYSKFIMIAVKDNVVVGYYTNVKGFILNDKIKYDAVYNGESDDKQIKIYKDSNNDNKIYAVLVVLLSYQNENADNSQKFLDTQARENFDILNTFRTNYGISILEWDNLLVQSSQAHCIDMAEKGYFAHNSLDGTTHKDRILATGIKNTIAWGENIVAGRELAVDTFDLWINSLGHRVNMLRENFTHVGIASIYKEGSIYNYYSGQNFVEKEFKDADKEEQNEEDEKYTVVFTF
ncbi:stalk domain-containing protein [Clostridium sp. MD294]|uniref:stalk domain-containing protein n=1 Tax=Clostridium sp. MD294 TaxID=97138 RepID=UPI0002CC0D61|nr:stalk domain-containing protein [Clostridium sp. MD294]NDO45677.1 hypothetical protein [Clostridium sp. MD294]USF30670.1 hypothetical protein C820_002113 [Clostridium sp. MD294]